MIIQPTGSLPGDFDAVNSLEIQDIIRKTLPDTAISRGRFSLIFKIEGSSDVEWKYASEVDRDTDYTAIIAAINSGGGSGSSSLQEVTDVGASTTNSIVVTNGSGGLVTITPDGNVIATGVVRDINTPSVVSATLSESDILSLGTGYNINLDPVLINQYFSIQKIYLEFVAGSTPYVSSEDIRISGAGFICVVSKELIQISAGEKAVICVTPSPSSVSGSDLVYSTVDMNGPIVLDTAGANPTAGDGTMRVSVYYNVRTFGA